MIALVVISMMFTLISAWKDINSINYYANWKRHKVGRTKIRKRGLTMKTPSKREVSPRNNNRHYWDMHA